VIKKNIKWSKEKIRNKIAMLKKEGEYLSPSYVQKKYPKLFSAAIRKKYFDSWRNALRKTGIDPDEEYQRYRNRKKDAKWTEKNIIEKIQSYSVDNLSNVYRNNKRLYSACYRIFDSWRDALKEAGRLEEYENHKKNILIKKIKNFHRKHGKRSVYKYNKKLYYQVYNEFGSWENGLEEAGII